MSENKTPQISYQTTLIFDFQRQGVHKLSNLI